MVSYSTQLTPQSTTIITELEPEHMYILPAGMTFCFPFKMRRYYTQVILDLADITPYETCFMPAMRCWPSLDPVGRSITAEPNYAESYVILGPNGVQWNFWLLDKKPILEEHDINRGIDFDTTYWMNVQNLQNKDHNFWLRFTFYGNGFIHVD